MSDPTYHDPHIALNRIYTRRRDRGETSLVDGQRTQGRGDATQGGDRTG